MKIRLIAAAAMIMVPLGYIVPGASAQTGDAQVRIAHFSPDAPAVDVYVDAKKVSNNVAYEKASNYLALPAGSHVVEIRATGTAPDSAPAVKASVDVAAQVAANTRRWWRGSAGLLNSVLTIAWFDGLGLPRLS